MILHRILWLIKVVGSLNVLKFKALHLRGFFYFGFGANSAESLLKNYRGNS